MRLKPKRFFRMRGIGFLGQTTIMLFIVCQFACVKLPPGLPMLSAEWATGYPELSGIFFKDSSRLQDFKDAGFTTVIFDLIDQEKTSCEYRYQLLARLDLYGYSQFTFVTGQSKYCMSNPFWMESVDSFVTMHNALSPVLQKRFLGYYLGDEPLPKDRERVDSLVTALRSRHPEKTLYINLQPYNIYEASFPDWKSYRNEADWYFRKFDMVSFDYYPFQNKGWSKLGHTASYYYRNLQLFAEMSDKYNKRFLAFPLASQCEPRLKYDPITKENLMFMTNAPIVYGAQGLVYWHYTDRYNHCHETAMYDVYDVGPDLACVLRDRPVKTAAYFWAADINKKIAARFRELQNAKWLATIHEGSNWNDTIINLDRHTSGNSSSYEPLNGCSDCGDFRKTSLPNALQPLGSFSSSCRCFVVGIFKKKEDFFLLALNKNRDSTQREEVTFRFRVPCSIDSFDCLQSKWTRVSQKADSIKITTVEPAEIFFLKLSLQNRPPGLR